MWKRPPSMTSTGPQSGKRESLSNVVYVTNVIGMQKKARQYLAGQGAGDDSTRDVIDHSDHIIRERDAMVVLFTLRCLLYEGCCLTPCLRRSTGCKSMMGDALTFASSSLTPPDDKSACVAILITLPCLPFCLTLCHNRNVSRIAQ